MAQKESTAAASMLDLIKDLEDLKKWIILILVGGETSYKCANKINSIYLKILDAILPAVPLCVDKNNRFIVTKSGNFGTVNTLVDIVNYFNEKV